jgi:hypothetical protein
MATAATATATIPPAVTTAAAAAAAAEAGGGGTYGARGGSSRQHALTSPAAPGTSAAGEALGLVANIVNITTNRGTNANKPAPKQMVKRGDGPARPSHATRMPP